MARIFTLPGLKNHDAVVVQARGPPLFLDTTEAQKAEKFFLGPPPPPPPLLSSSGSSTATLALG